jgi:hypothetical protein
MANGNRFVVDLGTLKLQDGEKRSIAAAIQGAVLTHLAAKYSLQGKTIKMDDGIGVAGLFVDLESGGKK